MLVCFVFISFDLILVLMVFFQGSFFNFFGLGQRFLLRFFRSILSFCLSLQCFLFRVILVCLISYLFFLFYFKFSEGGVVVFLFIFVFLEFSRGTFSKYGFRWLNSKFIFVQRVFLCWFFQFGLLFFSFICGFLFFYFSRSYQIIIY